jgi:hypothetical protein
VGFVGLLGWLVLERWIVVELVGLLGWLLLRWWLVGLLGWLVVELERRLFQRWMLGFERR